MPGTAAGTVRQARQGGLGHLGHPRLASRLLAGHHHVGLEDDSLQLHALFSQSAERGPQGRLGHLGAALEGMSSVHEHLGLDDGHQAALLAEGGVAGQGVGVRRQARPGGPALVAASSSGPRGAPWAAEVPALVGAP